LRAISPNGTPALGPSNKNMLRGFTLIAVTVIAALILTIGTYLTSISITDAAISQSHSASLRAYYLAQAAASEVIANLNQDFALYGRLTAGTLAEGNSTVSRNGVFDYKNSYTAYAVSITPSVATIFATGTVATLHGAAMRSVRVSIGTATGSSVVFPYAMLAGGQGSRESGNTTISDVTANLNNAALQINQIFHVRRDAVVAINNGDIKANQVLIEPGATLTVTGGTIQEGIAAEPLPRLDFDSTASNSWKNRASLFLTPEQFDALPNNSEFQGIIFVDGTPDDLQKNLTVQGVLVINGSFEIEAPSTLTILPSPRGSGLLVKDDLKIESTASINGLVYAGHWLQIENDDDDSPPHLEVTVTGGVVGWNIEFSGRPDTAINITYDRELASMPLDPEMNENSPLIAVNHWEEVY